MSKIGEMVECNPQVKLQKGASYNVVDIDSIAVGNRTVLGKHPEIYNGQSGCHFANGDTVLARITPCLENGKFAQVRCETQKGFGSTELFVFRGKKDKTDNDYVYYLIAMPFVRKMAANSMTGASGRQRADLEFIKKIEWSFPPLPTQRKIASILSAYDNLIENNNKRIKILEQMAENLYKEWFVRFRFPGHESTPLENGIPKGWAEKCLSDLIDVDPLLPIKKGIQVKSIPMEALSTNSMIVDENCIQLVDNPSGSHSQNGDTLVARITPCLENGKTGFVQCLDDGETATGSTEFIVLRSKELSPYYVYCFARSQYFRQTAILSMNGADGRQRVNVPKIKSMKIAKPSSDVINQFDSIVKPVFEEIYLLTKQNKNHIKQRNLLLPRLMSGKLAV